MKDLLEGIVEESIKLVKDIGDKGREEVKALMSKRTCLAEKVVYDYVRDSLIKELGRDFLLVAEGFPNFGDKNSKTKIILDPLDGTLFYVRARSLNPFHIAIPLAAIHGETYNDVTAVAIGDLISGEIWSADKNSKTISNVFGECKTTGNEAHDPMFLFDFYHYENAKLRIRLNKFLTPYSKEGVQGIGAGSNALSLVKVACGEADAYIGVKGLSPCEIAPGYLLVKNAGGYILSMDSGKEFGETLFDKDKKDEPIIAAKNERLAREIYNNLKI